MRLLHTYAAAAVALTLSCSSTSETTPTSGTPTSVTQMVGPEGGEIVVDGATVTIPKGALTATKQVTISSDGAVPAGFVALSKVFKCEPSGTDFAAPVTMRMPFTDDGKGPVTMFWSSAASPTFTDVGGESPDKKTVTATVLHFSSGFVGRAK